MVETFGGKAAPRKRKKGKDVWEWKRWDDNAADVAFQLLPYLKVKRKQAELAMHFREYVKEHKFFGGKVLTEEDKEQRELFAIKMSCLNA